MSLTFEGFAPSELAYAYRTQSQHPPAGVTEPPNESAWLAFTPIDNAQKSALLGPGLLSKIDRATCIPWPRRDTIWAVRRELFAQACATKSTRAQYHLAIAILSEIPRRRGFLQLNNRGQLAQTAGSIIDKARASATPPFNSKVEADEDAARYIEKLNLTADPAFAAVCKRAISMPESAVATPELDTLSSQGHNQMGVALYSTALYAHGQSFDLVRKAGRRHLVLGANVKNHQLFSAAVQRLTALFASHQIANAA